MSPRSLSHPFTRPTAHSRRSKARRAIARFEPLESRHVLDSVVVFNELNYNPGGVGETLEWIELHNELAVPVDLSGWRLDDGIDYAFAEGISIPANGYLVVAADPAALQTATGFSGALGPYANSLSNGGERVRLRNNSDRIMDEVDYRDDGDWPIAADGSGATLAKFDEDQSAATASNWRASVQSGGTPGAANFPTVDLTATESKPVSLLGDWRYNDTGTDLGTAWREPNYVDASWSQGPAVFHVGSDEVVTPVPLGLRYLPITGDADIGISSTKTYTHALDFGNGDNGAVVGGVPFTKVTGTNIATIPNFTWAVSSGSTTTSGISSGSNVTGSAVELFQDYISNAINAANGAATITLSNLVVGAHYDTRIYVRQLAAGTRNATIQFESTGGGAAEATTTINEENAAASPPGFATANQAYAISYDFVAGATSMQVRFTQPTFNRPWLLYALTNELRGGVINAPEAISTLYSTGIGDNGLPLSPGDADPHWYFTASQAPATTSAHHPAWLANNATSQWIGTTSQGVSDVPQGPYSYSTRFDLSGYDAATVALSLRIAVDDGLDYVRLNGVATGITTSGFAALNGPFTVNGPFLPGVNTLEFGVTNGGTAPNPSGLRVQFSGTAVPKLDKTLLAADRSTYYFRKAFEFAGPANADHDLDLNLLVDDGAIVYLNGQEIYRHNMPAGAVGYATPASSSLVNAQKTGRISVPSGALRQGTNVLALEVHQAALSGDIRFGAEAVITSTPRPPSDLPKIVFNEIAAADDPSFFVELTNADDQPIDVTGYKIRSSDELHSSYTLPSQTLAPGQLLVVDSVALGYTPADGDRLFLQLPSDGSVIDAKKVTLSVRGRAAGYGDRWLHPTLATPGAVNAFTFHDEIVLNEIHYHHQPVLPTLGTPASYQTTVLAPMDGVWRYNQRGQNLGTLWSQTSHAADNVNWFSGQGLLGFESATLSEPIRTTLINPANNSPYVTTYYFERDFNFAGNLADVEELTLRYFLDDGAVFYLNGVEFFRSNLTEGTPAYSTLAIAAVGDAASVGPVVVPKNQLVVGTNRLSVEVHQASTGSTDIVFGAELIARRLLAPPTVGTPFAESDEEWIELYNRGNHSVDMSGWKLRGAADFNFPIGTTLAAGAYLVVAKNAAALAVKYPAITIAGSFSGSLSDHDDAIRLEDTLENPADEVHYFENGRWSDLADGGGSSLELRDPDADNARGEAWGASIESNDAAWQTVTYRGLATPPPGSNDPTVFNEFIVGLLDAGEFLIDDVSVREDPNGTNIERIQNGGFNSGATAWRLVGNHGQHGLSGVIDEPGNPANKVLRVFASGASEHMSNHVETTFVGNAAIVSNREYQISFRVKWLGGNRQLNSRLYFNRLARTTELVAPQENGTPGAANSVLVPNIGPTYDNLRHGPVVPAPGQNVSVSVQAADPDGVQSMTLKYSTGGAFQNVVMTVGANGVYTGVIPPQPAATIVQFYVEGIDALGAVSMFPAAGPDSRALYKVNDGAATAGPRHNFRMIMTQADVNAMSPENIALSDHRRGATVIYKEDQVYYDVGARFKGSGYSRGSAATGYNIRFNAEQPFLGVHEIISIDRQGATAGLGASHRELVVKHIAAAAGDIHAMYDDVINFIAPNSSYNGSAQLLGARYDDVYLDSQFEDGGDGTRFKFELIYYRNTNDGQPEALKARPNTVLSVDVQDMGDDQNSYYWNYLISNNRTQNDYSRIIELAKTFSLSGSTVGSQLDTRSQAIIDVDQWLRNFAYTSLVGTGDTYNQGLPHNVQFFVRPSDGRIEAMPWDQDFSLNQSTSADIYGSGSNLRKIINIPSNIRLFQGHLLDIINTTYNTTYLAPWVAAYAPVSAADASSAILQYVTDRRAFVLSQLMAPVAFTITTNGGADFTVGDVVATLAGNGWINVREIRLAGSSEPLPVRWTDQDSWQVTLPVPFGSHPVVLEAYDFQGNLIATDSVTITSTESSRPLVDFLRIDEVMYHPADPSPAEIAAGFTDADDFEFIELLNIEPTQTMPLDLANAAFTAGVNLVFPAGKTLSPGGRAVVVANTAAFQMRYGTEIAILGEYEGQLNNAGETLTLLDRFGATVHNFAYDDTGPDWHPSTDGAGYSLVIRDAQGPVASWNDGAAWRPSGQLGGSPGQADATLLGDFNTDSAIDLLDLVILQGNLGTTSGATALTGDMNGDGAVNRADVAQFARRYGSVAPPASPSSSSAAPGAVVRRATVATTRFSVARVVAAARPALRARAVDQAIEATLDRATEGLSPGLRTRSNSATTPRRVSSRDRTS